MAEANSTESIPRRDNKSRMSTATADVSRSRLRNPNQQLTSSHLRGWLFHAPSAKKPRRDTHRKTTVCDTVGQSHTRHSSPPRPNGRLS